MNDARAMFTLNDTPATRVLTQALAGGVPAWPADASPALIDDLQAAADLHGVSALLHQAVSTPGWPPALRDALHHRRMQRSAWELSHVAAIRQALDHLAAAGIPVLVLKGTALAYSVYPDPALRERGDTDLLIRPADVSAAATALAAAGFARTNRPAGRWLRQQAEFLRPQRPDGAHAIDLHWQMSDSPLLSALWSWDELEQDSVALPALHPTARGLGWPHAALNACLHAAYHEHSVYQVGDQVLPGVSRLIWLIDLVRLAGHAGDDDWRAFDVLARRSGVAGLCAQHWRTAQTYCGAVVPSGALAPSDAPDRTAVADYLASVPWRRHLRDLGALPDLRSRAGLVREVLLPPHEYLRSLYPRTPAPLLPLRYVTRAVSGGWRRLVRGDTAQRRRAARDARPSM